MTNIIFSSYDSINNPYYAGGGAIAIHEVAKRLAKRFRVKIIAGAYPGSANSTEDGVFYQFIGPKNLPPKISQLLFSVLLPCKVITSKFDLWFESFTPPFSTACLQLFTRKPVIGVAHMLAGEDMKKKFFLPFDVIENFGLKTYKTIIATSEMFAKKIKQMAPKANVSIIPNGIDKVEQLKRSGKYYLFIGRIEVNQKGLDILIETFSELAKEKLIICGSGEVREMAKLNSLLIDNNLQDRVKVIGKKNHSEIKELVKNAKAILVTSRFETFSMVALESLAMGVPLVSFDIPGLKWLPDNCSHKVHSIKSSDLVIAIRNLSKQKAETKAKVQNGLKFASGLTWDNISGKYENLIHQIIN